MSIEVRRLSAATRNDFNSVHCEKNGEGWCQCVAWWVPSWEGWDKRSREENLALREELFRRGEYDGYLLYSGGAPVGWCQVGPRDRLRKLQEQHSLPPDPSIWAISCLLLLPSFRKQGLAHRFLAEILRDLTSRGVRKAQCGKFFVMSGG